MRHLISFLISGLAINCFAGQPQHLLAPNDDSDGVVGGYEYVDLGLPSGTLWATCNVGATSPYETGHFFAWGEVEPREDFTWESYKFFQGYEYDPNNGSWAILEDIGSDICGTEYDVARYQWGNGWRLPNEQERYELRMLCWTNGATEENGVYGVRMYGPNSHSIFLPICGYGLWNGMPDPFNDISAAYLTGIEEPASGVNGRPIEPSNRAVAFSVDRYGGFTGASVVKAYGSSVRAVVNPKEAGIDNAVSDNEEIRLTYYNGGIHVIGNHSEGIIKVYDLSGRITYSGSIVDDTCQLPELAEGIYIISYDDKGSRITTQKITIK